MTRRFSAAFANRPWMRLTREVLILLTILLAACPVSLAAADGESLDNLMYQDPEITFPEPIRVFSDRLKPLWLEALASSEVDLQRQAAESFARAHDRGLKDLDDIVEPLVDKVRSPKTNLLVRLASARTLVKLDAKHSADELFKFAKQGGLDAAQIIEPALAQWDFEPARAVWLARLNESHPSRRRLHLAIRGLAEVGEEKAAAKLRAFVKSSSASSAVRLESARALGRIRKSGNEALASKLMGDGTSSTLLDRLLAASLLAHHSSNSALLLLEKLALDDEPAVAGVALRRLLETDSSRIVGLAGRLLISRDANVRYFTGRALVDRPAIRTIQQLASLLNDPHPRNRRYARQSLIELAGQVQFDATVRSLAMDTIGSENWRGIEQALLILVALDHKRAAARCVELLRFERPEVRVTAAWALRKLAVRSTLQPALEHARRVSHQDAEPKYDFGASDRQVAHLFEAFCQMEYVEAEPLMRQYIPKASHPVLSRAAAIWALGHFHSGDLDAELAKLLRERLTDVENQTDPESTEVGRMAAISLGRMKDEAALPKLRYFLDNYSVNSELGYACGWAMQQITGEPPPKQKTRIINEIGWFLQPLERKAK